MKTVNLNSVTLKKNGTPVELMGVTDKEKEWEDIVNTVLTEDTVLNFENIGEYENIAIYIEIPIGNTQPTFTVTFKSKDGVGILGAEVAGLSSATTAPKCVICFVQCLNGEYFIKRSNASSYYWNTMQELQYSYFMQKSLKKLGYIGGLHTNTAIKSGNKLIVRGVKA